MATLSSLQDRLQGLGSRLRAENESQSRDRMNTHLNLDFTRERPGSERRPRPLPLADCRIPGRPNTISARPRERPKIEPLLFEPKKTTADQPELDAKVKDISRKNGDLTIDNKKYKSTIDDMEYLSELGNGTSGNVVKMRHKPSNKIIAVKQMRRSGNLEETKRVFFDLEVVLKSHDCPYIVQCLGCFVTDSDVWICMELMATCLDKLTKRYKQPLPEPILGKISVATLKALHYLKEEHGVIHRDVKPSNILLDERGNIKLCDFGISGRLVDSKAKTRSAGCAAYMAPERIDPPDPTRPDYDIRADVWSLGITLVELATGQFPYKDCRNDFEVLTKVLQEDPPVLPLDKKFSPEFCQFVNDCLIKNYQHRPKYKKLLGYTFIKQFESKKVDVSAWFSGFNKPLGKRHSWQGEAPHLADMCFEEAPIRTQRGSSVTPIVPSHSHPDTPDTPKEIRRALINYERNSFNEICDPLETLLFRRGSLSSESSEVTTPVGPFSSEGATPVSSLSPDVTPAGPLSPATTSSGRISPETPAGRMSPDVSSGYISSDVASGHMSPDIPSRYMSPETVAGYISPELVDSLLYSEIVDEEDLRKPLYFEEKQVGETSRQDKLMHQKFKKLLPNASPVSPPLHSGASWMSNPVQTTTSRPPTPSDKKAPSTPTHGQNGPAKPLPWMMNKTANTNIDLPWLNNSNNTNNAASKSSQGRYQEENMASVQQLPQCEKILTGDNTLSRSLPLEPVFLKKPDSPPVELSFKQHMPILVTRSNESPCRVALRSSESPCRVTVRNSESPGRFSAQYRCASRGDTERGEEGNFTQHVPLILNRSLESPATSEYIGSIQPPRQSTFVKARSLPPPIPPRSAYASHSATSHIVLHNQGAYHHPASHQGPLHHPGSAQQDGSQQGSSYFSGYNSSNSQQPEAQGFEPQQSHVQSLGSDIHQSGGYPLSPQGGGSQQPNQHPQQQDVCRMSEQRGVRSSPQRVSIFSSPLLPRASRSSSRPPSVSSTGGNNAEAAPPPPPPVAPRRRSRTPEAHSHERTNQQKQPLSPKKDQQNEVILNGTHKEGSTVQQSSAGGRSIAPPASPSLGRGVSASPSRCIPPVSPAPPQPSRAMSASPLQRGGGSTAPPPPPPHSYPAGGGGSANNHLGSYASLPPTNSSSPSHRDHYHSQQQPQHQYASAPFNSQSFSPFNYSPKPYGGSGGGNSNSQVASYSQYSNPYTQVIPPRSSPSSFYNQSSSGSGGISGSSNSTSTGPATGPLSWPAGSGSRDPWGGSSATAATTTSTTGNSGSTTTSSTTSVTGTPPMHRKTPEPVRYSQEAFYNSRPYYTPEPQRRIIPRLGNP